MIICEGPDNAGKTTLLKRLSGEFYLPIIKSPGPMEEKEIFKWCINQMYHPDSDFIFYDRFAAISDCIYGPLIRGGSPFIEKEEGKAIQNLLKYKAVIIYCRPPEENILNFQKPEMDGVIDNAHKMINDYDELTGRLLINGWNILLYDYTHQGDYSFIKKEVEKCLNT